MMYPILRIGSVMLASALSACGFMNVTFIQYGGADKACVSGGDAGLLSMLGEGQAHFVITSIDGDKTNPMATNCLKPGEHSIGYTTTLSTKNMAAGSLRLQMEANKSYKVVSFLRGDVFRISVLDLQDSSVVLQHTQPFVPR